MTLATLQDLYRAELDDLYDAEQQIVAALPKLSAAAASSDLKAAFDKHLERSRIHIERLDVIFKKLGATRSGVRSAAMETLIREGDTRIQLATDPDTRDAALIAAAQHVEHYEMAGYGCARTYARQLNDEHAADLLQQTLDEEGSADHELTHIAEMGINQAARQGQTLDSQESSRLRYVDADDFEGETFDPSDIHVRSRKGEDLGHIDGFLVDETGRPVYFVVDSGGWFLGRHYLLPVGTAKRESAGERALVVDIDKHTFKRYPEFHKQGFMAMSNDEARRYEWRVLEAIDPNAARQRPAAAIVYEEYEYYRAPAWLGAGTTTGTDRDRSRTSTARGTQPATGTRERTPSHDRDEVIAREEGERPRPPKPGSDVR